LLSGKTISTSYVGFLRNVLFRIRQPYVYSVVMEQLQYATVSTVGMRRTFDPNRLGS